MLDVNLATHLLKDGFLGLGDVAIDNRSNRPEPDFVFCAWRTNDAKHDMTPQEVLWSPPAPPRAGPHCRRGLGLGLSWG
jgi:hypothetical protein